MQIATNEERIEVANIIKKNLEAIGFKITIREINEIYYKNNLQKLNYDILLTGKTVSIKPEIGEYLELENENKTINEDEYSKIYDMYNENPSFLGLYFDAIILLYSKNLKGNFSGNWYDIFYNIDTWYKLEPQ